VGTTVSDIESDVVCSWLWERFFSNGRSAADGTIPVYVYRDVIWLPDYDSIDCSSLADVTHIDELENVLRKAKAELTLENLMEMRKKV
jgi:hypothetical protein